MSQTSRVLKEAEEQFRKAAQTVADGLARAAIQDALKDAAELTAGAQSQSEEPEPVKERLAGAPPLAKPIECGCPAKPKSRAPRVYICGPMQYIEGFNFPAFDAAAAEWREAGWEVLNPADMDRQDPVDVEDLKLNKPTPARRKIVMRDLDALQLADAVAVLTLYGFSVPGSGSFGERGVAAWLRVPVWYQMRSLTGTSWHEGDPEWGVL